MNNLRPKYLKFTIDVYEDKLKMSKDGNCITELGQNHIKIEKLNFNDFYIDENNVCHLIFDKNELINSLED